MTGIAIVGTGMWAPRLAAAYPQGVLPFRRTFFVAGRPGDVPRLG